MPTLKQRKVAKALLDNALIDNPPTMGEMLEKVGYAKSVAEAKPGEIIDSQGVKDALAEYGLTEELITTALVHDIENKPKNRLGELRLGAELLGKLKQPDGGNKTLLLIQFDNSFNVTAPSTETSC